MDPISALSLAANVIQFVDFGSRLLSEGNEIFSSITGLSVENEEYETVYEGLGRLSQKLMLLAPPSAPSAPSAVSSEEVMSMRTLAGKCKELADELISELNGLKIPPQACHKRWKSFRQALKGLWKKEKIEAFKKRLEGLRDQLSIQLIAMVKDQQSDFMQSMQKLIYDSNLVNSSHKEQLRKLSSELAFTRQSILLVPTKDDLENLTTHLSSLTIAASRIATEHVNSIILRSLHFPSLRVRHDKIPIAHARTFDWIFENDNDSSRDLKFMKWLRSEGGIYWISGKAGSGKSTFMKYVSDHVRTEEALTQWARDSKLLIGSYYFWNAGTALQKSQEGLLRSLLYEVLEQCPDLIPGVCPSRWDSISRLSRDGGPWSMMELARTVRRLMHQEKVVASFCFFIDGLDEYDGDHNEIVQIVDELGKTQRIKICLSSRPWNIFEDAFGQGSNRKLALQDLTRGDVEIYVKNKLETHPSFGHIVKENERYQSLIQRIVERSQGVFLWVYLVVRSLHEGLTNGDSLQTLEMRLRLLPTDLERYFQHILSQVDVLYQEQMARSFQYALHAAGPLTLMTHSFLDEFDQDFAFKIPVKPYDKHDIYLRHAKMRRRLNARCKGLLEVCVEPSATDFFCHQVQFLHRTVRDFLRTKDVQNMLAKYLDKSFNASALICRAYLAVIKTMPREANLANCVILPAQVDHLMYYARQAELDKGKADVDLFDHLEDVVKQLSKIYKGTVLRYSRPNSENFRGVEVVHCSSLFEFAVATGLEVYVREKVTSRSFHYPEPSQPLLSAALQPCGCLDHQEMDFTGVVKLALDIGEDPNKFYYKQTGPSVFHYSNPDPIACLWGDWLMEVGKNFSSQSANNNRLKTLELVLRYRASPNGKYRETTVWLAFLGWLYSRREETMSTREMKFYFDIADLLLRYGANVRASVPLGDASIPQTKEVSQDTVFNTLSPQLASRLKERTNRRRAWKVARGVQTFRPKPTRSCGCNIFAWMAKFHWNDESRRPLLQDYT